jgi:hypothetical protein
MLTWLLQPIFRRRGRKGYEKGVNRKLEHEGLTGMSIYGK